MIEAVGVSKIFETSNVRTTAVRDVSLSVAVGDFIALTGVSGSGKSTLLSILGLLDTPTSGKVFLDGLDVSSRRPAMLHKMRSEYFGYIFQGFHLIDEISVLDNVSLALKYRGVGRENRREQSIAALEKVGLGSRIEHYPSQLSGGQKQRVGIARAIVTAPKCILADEPTGNLDSENGSVVMELLRNLNGDGTSVLVVTHSNQDARYASRQLKMCDGEISE